MSLPIKPRRTKIGDYVRQLDASTRRATMRGGSGMSVSVTTEGTTVRAKKSITGGDGGSTSNVPRWG